MLDGIVIVFGAALVSYFVPGAVARKVCDEDDDGIETCTDENPVRRGLPVAAKAAIAVVSIVILFLCLAVFFCVRRSRKAAEEADKEVMVEASQITGPPAILHANYTPETGHSRVYSIGPDTGGLSAVPIPLTPAPPPLQTSTLNGNSVQAPVPSANPWAPVFPVASVASSPAVAPSPAVVPTPVKQSVFSRWAAVAQGNSTGAGGASQPQTAPAQKATFDKTYPFTGFGNDAGNKDNNAAQTTQPRSAMVSNGFPRPLLAGRLKDRIRERPASVSQLAATDVAPGSPTTGAPVGK